MQAGFVFLAAAWVAWLAAFAYGNWLHAPFSGRAEDVVDSLGRAAYVGKRTQWLSCAALVLDAIAVFAHFDARIAEGQRARRTFGLALDIASATWHGPCACVGYMFAG